MELLIGTVRFLASEAMTISEQNVDRSLASAAAAAAAGGTLNQTPVTVTVEASGGLISPIRSTPSSSAIGN